MRRLCHSSLSVTIREEADMPAIRDTDLESEFEQASETGGEGFGLGDIGGMLGGLLGEGESIGASEFELEGEFEDELEGEFELENEFEGEFEGEGFSFGGLFKKIAPVLKKVAKVAAPMVGTAILGPAGGALGKLAASALGEGEFELEFELEGEFEGEGELETEFEGEAEMEQEIAAHPMTENEALAEMMAEAASQAASETEAEAMVGAAVVTVLSPRDRRALRRMLPHLVRGAAVLTRILRRHHATRHAVRAVPQIMRRSVKRLKRHAASGRPVTRGAVARATAHEVRRVLGSPRAVRTALVRNARTARAVKRPQRRHHRVAG